jgi:hypothetical protein
MLAQRQLLPPPLAPRILRGDTLLGVVVDPLNQLAVRAPGSSVAGGGHERRHNVPDHGTKQLEVVAEPRVVTEQLQGPALAAQQHIRANQGKLAYQDRTWVARQRRARVGSP